ncbi:GNAT family N-acetyltransferase [Microterricola pindariensis]|uniref:GNAT family N-acetyltransferase n=1 Tax=Microterricola pindariensis TaxID=478010 RepID=A0ABX5AZC4_9MICO|nr:GNAT family N-acetyltransferase [Microterricola pindariensis]PPL20268.1 GNAT family N-acetyltransferase [Microterricola pindariensis]
MPTLQLLRADHAPAVLAFERQNRAYFGAAVPDRGDGYFAEYAERHAALLAEQASGDGAYYVLVDEDGAVLGRFNLVFTGDGDAELGYRVAQHAAGRGLATSAVRELCLLAASRHGARSVAASAATENAASQKVLTNAGFVAVGPADPASLGGSQGTRYERGLEPS